MLILTADNFLANFCNGEFSLRHLSSMTPARATVSRRPGGALRAGALVVFIAASLSMAAEPLRKQFDLPAGSADKSLKQFSQQAGLELIFSTRIAREVKTNAVKGEMTAREALDAMLARTGLVVIQDQKTGAFTVSRKNGSTLAPPGIPPRDSQKKNNNETFQTQEPIKRTGTQSPPIMNSRNFIAGFTGWIALAFAVQHSAAADTDETTVLSPFTVSSERVYGYQATDAITATGIGTPIRNVPVNIAVLTPDLIQDRGVDDIRWIANTVSGLNTNTREFTGITVRGYTAPIQQDGFDDVFLSMEDADRIEVIKGPAAVFFGTNLPGGMLNVVKGKPSFKRQNYISARYGSYDMHRASAMFTGPLISNRLAYRIFASSRSESGELDHTDNEVENYRGALTWRPFNRLSLTTSIEYTDKQHLRHHGFPVGHPAYIAAANAGQVPVGLAQRTWLDRNPLYGPNEPLGQVFMHRQVLPNINYNTQGPDSGFIFRALNFGVAGDLNIMKGLDVTVGVNWGERNTDQTEWNSFRPVAGANPGTFFIPAAAASTGLGETMSQGTKARAAYRPDFWGTKHTIVAGLDDFWSQTASRTYFGTARSFNPLVDPPRMLRAEVRANNPGGLPAPKASSARKATTRGYFATDQVAMLANRLRLMVGLRHTRTTNAAGLRREKTTPQYGMMFTPVSLASIYVNMSETFQPNYLLDVYGNSIGPTLGKGKEVGIKLATSDQRTSATISVYENTRSNVAIRDWPREALLDIRPLYQLGGLERNRGVELDVHLAPADNYQIVGSYTHSWEHKTIASTGEPRQVGVDLASVPDHVFNFWNKYTFRRGALKGAFLGGGARFATSERLHQSWDVPIRSGGYVKMDAVIGYQWLFHSNRIATQINLNNLTNERAFVGAYILSDPFTAAWTVRWDF